MSEARMARRIARIEGRHSALRELSTEIVKFIFEAVTTGFRDGDLNKEQERFMALIASTGEQDRQSDIDQLRDTCERIGYGRVMHLASALWAEKAGNRGEPGANFVVGPCAESAVRCFCAEDGSACDFCGGAGWLTKSVKALVRQVREA